MCIRDRESGNTVDMALNSNSYTHAMSYVSRGQEYLDGHGWGSSYLLETYTDYGWIGIVLFSLAIGFVLVYALSLIHIWTTTTAGILWMPTERWTLPPT